jgi:hypothetical protein
MVSSTAPHELRYEVYKRSTSRLRSRFETHFDKWVSNLKPEVFLKTAPNLWFLKTSGFEKPEVFLRFFSC